MGDIIVRAFSLCSTSLGPWEAGLQRLFRRTSWPPLTVGFRHGVLLEGAENSGRTGGVREFALRSNHSRVTASLYLRHSCFGWARRPSCSHCSPMPRGSCGSVLASLRNCTISSHPHLCRRYLSSPVPCSILWFPLERYPGSFSDQLPKPIQVQPRAGH